MRSGRWRRSGTTATPAVGRRDRGADGRADRAGLVSWRRLQLGHDPEPLVLRRRHVPLGLPARRRHQVLDQREQHLYSGRRPAASCEAPSFYDSRVDGVLAASTRRRRVRGIVARDESTAAASRRSRPAQASSN